MDMHKIEEWFLKKQFNGKSRLRVYRKLSRLQKNGVPLIQALDTIWSHASRDGKKPKEPTAVAVASWKRQIANGKDLGVAMQGWVPETDRQIIEAGQKSGRLSTAVDDAIFIFQGRRRIKSALAAGLTYPVVLVAAAVALLMIVGWKIVPTFSQILPKEQWTGSGAWLGYLADFVDEGLVPLIFIILAMVMTITWSMPRWTGNIRIKLDSMPPYSLYRLVVGSGFLLSLATLVGAGVKTTDALRLMQRDASPWLMERISKALSIMNNGHNIGEALYRSEMNFPDRETVNDLRTYASLDKFEDALVMIGKENLEETVTKIEQQSGVMRNGGIIVLAFVFALIASGIFSLMQQMQSRF